MCSLVLIEQFCSSSDCWGYLIRKKKIQNLSVEEVVQRYQGFEGELISVFSSENESIKSSRDIIIESGKQQINNYRLIYVASEARAPPVLLNMQAFFVGYDVGVCDEDKTIYSSIFNEIIFGNLLELIDFKKFLNTNLLFADKSTAIEYVNVHNEMSAQGKDVEDYEEMVIYEIWKYLKR